MSEAKVTERNSASSSAGTGAPASEVIACLTRRAGHCNRLLTLEMNRALTSNTSHSLLEDFVNIMQKPLASLNAAKRKSYQQLMESGALTKEAISASLTQGEASELEYRAGVAELRDKLCASSPTSCETGAAPLFSTNSIAGLLTLASAPPPVFNFELPN